MGLDLVEIVMQCEEDFGITFEDSDAEQIRTVGDLYLLVCRQLGVGPVDTALVDLGLSRQIFGPLKPSLRDTTGDVVWAKVVRIVVDQLQVEERDVGFDSRFSEDLGCD